MAVALWIVQALLGLLFVITGSFKFFQNREKIVASGGTWAADFNPAVIKIIAAVELICGIMVILPKILALNPYLVVVAAACIALIMIGAVVIHLRRAEYKHAIINVVFLLLAAFTVYANKPL